MLRYNSRFYEIRHDLSVISAQEIVPQIMQLVRPRSIVDIGCGVGTWLAEFRRNGVADIFGVEGGKIRHRLLQVPRDKVLQHDLEQPLRMDRRFDLVISLEVAEHIPEKYADEFVDALVRLGDVIVFSAAVPYQGGVNHVNEQWQEYWANKFEARNYQTIDCIRPRLWNNQKIHWWYAQNTLLYIASSRLKDFPQLQEEALHGAQIPLSVIHPRHYLKAAEPSFLKLLYRSLKHKVSHRHKDKEILLKRGRNFQREIAE